MRNPGPKYDQASEILQRYVLLSMAVPLVPLPLFDLTALWTLQLAMLRALSEVYGEEFSDGWGKKTVATLLGGLAPLVYFVPMFSILRVVPGLGHAVAVLGMPVLAGAATYAVGMVFIRHFESGGTVATFDAGAKKELFRECYEEGKRFATANRSKAETTCQQNQTAGADAASTTPRHATGSKQAVVDPKVTFEAADTAAHQGRFEAGSAILNRSSPCTLSDKSMMVVTLPLPRGGQVTRWEIWAESTNPVQLVVYRRAGDLWSVAWVSELYTPTIGRNEFAPATPIVVQAGDCIGWYFPQTRTISFDRDFGGWSLGDLTGAVLDVDAANRRESRPSGCRMYSMRNLSPNRAPELKQGAPDPSNWALRCWTGSSWQPKPLDDIDCSLERDALAIKNTNQLHSHAFVAYTPDVLQGDFTAIGDIRGTAKGICIHSEDGSDARFEGRLPGDVDWHRFVVQRQGCDVTFTVDDEPVQLSFQRCDASLAGFFCIDLLHNQQCEIRDFKLTIPETGKAHNAPQAEQEFTPELITLRDKPTQIRETPAAKSVKSAESPRAKHEPTAQTPLASAQANVPSEPPAAIGERPDPVGQPSQQSPPNDPHQALTTPDEEPPSVERSNRSTRDWELPRPLTSGGIAAFLAGLAVAFLIAIVTFRQSDVSLSKESLSQLASLQEQVNGVGTSLERQELVHAISAVAKSLEEGIDAEKLKSLTALHNALLKEIAAQSGATAPDGGPTKPISGRQRPSASAAIDLAIAAVEEAEESRCRGEDRVQQSKYIDRAIAAAEHAMSLVSIDLDD